jgi:hypothetical protein
MSNSPVRGVVDRFEGDYAVVVLDDDQQINWPRSALPSEVTPGTAVVLSLSFVAHRFPPGYVYECESKDVVAARAPTGLRATLIHDVDSGQWLLQIAGGETLRWPVEGEAMAQSGGMVNLELTPDAEDTAARRQRVAGLLDDIFGPAGS